MSIDGHHSSSAVLLIASDLELPSNRRVWGTGGWMKPEEREALDWLILCRLLGWRVRILHPADCDFDAVLSRASGWVILGCAPEILSDDRAELLVRTIHERAVLAITRAAAPESRLAALVGASRRAEKIAGERLLWDGPGLAREWLLRSPMCAPSLALSPSTSVWARLDGEPIVAAARLGRGTLVTLGFHPSEARDGHGFVTALIRHVLTYGAARPVAWYDFSNTLILRMDDPGGAQNVHSQRWHHRKLDDDDWAGIAAALAQRQARVSIGYVTGWVDDGDSRRGDLMIDGWPAERIPGAVHPSPLVEYRDRCGHAPGTLHDYRSEFRGIGRLRAMGLGDVELHGHTHMHPDVTAWARAEDRYEGVDWFRELGRAHIATIEARAAEQHPLRLGTNGLSRFFGVQPTTLICPGDQWTDAALETALDIGLDLVGSYYLALRDGDRFCWATHICAPYLDEPADQWFDSGLPVVGYFHDRDPAIKGIGWVSEWLNRWGAVGARRMIDFREFAGAVMRPLELTVSEENLHLRFVDGRAPDLVRAPRIRIYAPAGNLPSQLAVFVGAQTCRWAVRHETGTEAELVPHIGDLHGHRRLVG